MAEYERFAIDQGSDIAIELELVDANDNSKNFEIPKIIIIHSFILHSSNYKAIEHDTTSKYKSCI